MDLPVLPLDSLLVPWAEQVRQVWSGEVQPRIVPTGLSTLDRYVGGGLRPAQVTVLAARPSMGKTSLALTIARNVAASAPEGECVVVFSLEMSADDILHVLVSQVAGLRQYQLDSSLQDCESKLQEMLRQKLDQAVQALGRLPLLLDTTAALAPRVLIERLRELRAVYGLRLVVIDYLQLLHLPAAENRNVAVSEAMRQLAAAAKELDCPMLVVSQLSRGVERDERNTARVPDLHHLRDSGSIEQDASNVWLLHRPDYYANPADVAVEERGVAWVYLAKQRRGRRRIRVPLLFQSDYTRFVDLPAERLTALQRRVRDWSY